MALHQSPCDHQELGGQLDLHLQLDASLQFPTFEQSGEIVTDGGVLVAGNDGGLNQGVAQTGLALFGDHRYGALTLGAASVGAQVKSRQAWEKRGRS